MKDTKTEILKSFDEFYSELWDIWENHPTISLSFEVWRKDQVKEWLSTSLDQVREQTEKEKTELFIKILRDTVDDKDSRLKLKNRYGIDLNMEDTFASLEKMRVDIDEALTKLKGEKK